jgi:RNA polymerase sigma-70 factor (ECF subfamily)
LEEIGSDELAQPTVVTRQVVSGNVGPVHDPPPSESLSNVTLHSDADVARARSGDQAAFGRLIECRWIRLVRLARSIVGDLDAEDVAQDACLVCWRKLSQLADPARFDSWLMRIVFTRAVRRARWQRVRSFISWDPASAGLAPDAECDLLVEQILSRLAPRQRAVVHLTVVEGMTDSEIAEALGIRAGSVRAHRRRARQIMKALVRSPIRDAGLQPCETPKS